MAFPMDEPELDEQDQEWAERTAPQKNSVRIIIEGAPADTAVLKSLARLLLGGGIEGSEQLGVRLQEWQRQTDAQKATIYSESPDETEAERLRYALIGLLAAAPAATQSVLGRVYNASDSAYYYLTDWLTPVTGSRFFAPVQRRYDQLAARGESVFERWIDSGRKAEQESRALARKAAFEGEDEAFDHVISVMAEKPEVRDLITQQSMGMADEVVAVVRKSTASADNVWERRVQRLLRRK